MDIGVWLLFTAYVYTFEEEHFFQCVCVTIFPKQIISLLLWIEIKYTIVKKIFFLKK